MGQLYNVAIYVHQFLSMAPQAISVSPGSKEIAFFFKLH